MKFDRIGPAGNRNNLTGDRSSRIGPSRDAPRWLPAVLFSSAAFYLVIFSLVLA